MNLIKIIIIIIQIFIQNFEVTVSQFSFKIIQLFYYTER